MGCPWIPSSICTYNPKQGRPALESPKFFPDFRHMNSVQMGIFRKLLIIDRFSPRLPTPRGQLWRKWNWTAAGRRAKVFRENVSLLVTGGVFYFVPQIAPGSGWGESRALWLALEAGLQDLPCQQAQTPHRSFPSSREPLCTGLTFK